MNMDDMNANDMIWCDMDIPTFSAYIIGINDETTKYIVNCIQS